MYPCPARVRTALGAPSSHCRHRNPPQGERRASPAKPAPPEAWKPMHMTKICSSFIHHGIECWDRTTTDHHYHWHPLTTKTMRRTLHLQTTCELCLAFMFLHDGKKWKSYEINCSNNSRLCTKVQNPKAFRWPSLDVLFKRQKSEMAIEHSSNPLSSLYTGLLIQVPRPIRGPKISQQTR